MKTAYALRMMFRVLAGEKVGYTDVESDGLAEANGTED
jgi:hypothetical protein